MMKRVITYGTFDLLHYGHINLLRRAKELGEYLIVVVSTDEFNWNEKKKKWWYNLFISILHIFVPSSKKVLKKKR